MEQSLAGILYSLANGLALAFFYTLNKKVTRAGRPLQIIFWLFVAHLPPIFVWSITQLPLHVDNAYYLPGAGSLLLNILGNLMAVRGLSLSPFSLMLPVMCLSPVFTSLLGIPLLQEWPTMVQWGGSILCVIGILSLYAPPEKPWDIFTFWPRFIRERGAPYMAISALCWSLCAPVDKLALRHADPAFHAAFVYTGLVITLFIWLSLQREWTTAPIQRSFWLILAATGVAGASADILQLFALMHAHAGTVEAIKRVASQVIGIGMGAVMFREPITTPKFIGITIICVGVPLIVL